MERTLATHSWLLPHLYPRSSCATMAAISAPVALPAAPAQPSRQSRATVFSCFAAALPAQPLPSPTQFEAVAADNNISATSSPWTSNALTTANQNEILITCVDNDTIQHTYTPPSGFTTTDASLNASCAYKIVSARQTAVTFVWTGTGAADNVAVTAASFAGAVAGHHPLAF